MALIGRGDHVEAVARAAAAVVRRDRDLALRLLPGAGSLGSGRRSLRARKPAPPVSTRSHLWLTVLSAGLLGSLVSLAQAGPPRASRTPVPSIDEPLLVISTVVAVVAVSASLATLRWVDRSHEYVALVMCTVMAVFLGAVLVFRLFVGADGGIPYEPGVHRRWLAASLLVLGELVTLALVLRTRAPQLRTRGAPLSTRQHRREERELLATAHRLAAITPEPGPPTTRLAVRWRRALDDLGGEVAAPTLAQAAELGPVPWLVWTSHRGWTHHR